MAKNQVTLTFAGESRNLEQTFDRVGSGSQRMGRDVGESSERFSRAGEAADTLDTRAMGMRDTFTGVQDTFQAFNKEGASMQERALLLGMGIGDLGSGIFNFGQQFARQAVQFAQNAGRMVASMATTVASTVAGWITMGVAALANAAVMAAAWLISLGPLALVVLAIGAVIGILAFLGVGFDDIKNVAGAAWDFILGAVQGVFNWLKSNWPLVLAILTGPIGLAVLAVVKHKDTIIGAFRAAFDFVKGAATGAKDWIVGRVNDIVSFITGLPGRVAGVGAGIGRAITSGIKGVWNAFARSLNAIIPNSVGIGPARINLPDNPIPTFHQGGLVPGAPGTEMLALLQAGERVTRPGAAGGPTIIINVQGTVIRERELIGLVRDEILRRGFGGAFA